jgi:hypothetical protein
MDMLLHFVHPTHGTFWVGREGTVRTRAAARRFLCGQGEHRRKTDADRMGDFVPRLLVERIVIPNQVLTPSLCDSILQQAFKQSRDKFVSFKHFIPCAMFRPEKTREFKIGPVHFQAHDLFLERNRAALENHRREFPARRSPENASAEDSATQEKAVAAQRKFADSMIDGVLEFFGEYSWIAEVTIPDCDPKISDQQALFLTHSALDVIKLMLGRDYSSQFRTAYERDIHKMSARLKLSLSDGKYAIATTHGGYGHVQGESVVDAIFNTNGFFIAAACWALNQCAGFSSGPSLCHRFMDAVAWHGDAVSEARLAARVIKLVTAIEMLVGTGEERGADGKVIRGVTEIVTERAAILYSDRDISLDEARRTLKRIYTWRSDLTHGSKSPNDENLPAVAIEAQEVTRLVLLSGLDFFVSLPNPDLTTKELKLEFDELERDPEAKTRAAKSESRPIGDHSDLNSRTKEQSKNHPGTFGEQRGDEIPSCPGGRPAGPEGLVQFGQCGSADAAAQCADLGQAGG